MLATRRDSMFRVPAPAVAGGVLWLLLLVLPPETTASGLAARLLQLAMLVIVPLALPLVALPHAAQPRPWPYRAALRLHLAAALPAALSFAVPAGLVAAALTLPWLALTGLAAVFGLARLRWHGRDRIEEFAIDAGLIYLVVGGGWLVLSRLGLRPLGFSDAIVLLTAVHFHYAGFAAPILAGLTGRALAATGSAAGPAFRWLVVAVIAGPALVAAGITLAGLGLSRLPELVATLVQATGLLGQAVLTLASVVPRQSRPVVRALLTVAALAVLAGMALAVAYAAGQFTGAPLIGIPAMVVTHGLLNAVGFALGGLLAWTIAPPPATMPPAGR